jgi:hypothetical protein
MLDRRHDTDRIPLRMFLNEYVSDRLHRAVTANISPTGLYVHRVYAAGLRRLQFGREDRYVQLEFTLPDCEEVIWARGEIRYDELDAAEPAPEPRRRRGEISRPSASTSMVHGTGISITDIAAAHARLLRDYVHDRKRQRLQEILTLIRHNRYH